VDRQIVPDGGCTRNSNSIVRLLLQTVMLTGSSVTVFLCICIMFVIRLH